MDAMIKISFLTLSGWILNHTGDKVEYKTMMEFCFAAKNKTRIWFLGFHYDFDKI